MNHKIYIVDKQEKVKVPSGIRILIRRSCKAALIQEGFTQSCEIGVTFVDNVQIKELNHTYRNKDSETDVLSFPLGIDGVYDKNVETGMLLLGDIVISLEKALEQAALYAHSLQREVSYLTVHSMFHLLGYDHEEQGMSAVKMREKEEETMQKLGLPRTTAYSDPTLER